MLAHLIFPKKLPVSSTNLPLTLISLETWILIKFNGKDIIQYLNNQFTCDIKNLSKHQYSFSAYCNPQGKMISNMYVFYYNDQEIACIMPMDIYEKQIINMKKYLIFSKVTITPEYNTILMGITGTYTKKYLNTFYPKLPDQKNTIIRYQDIIFLYFNRPIQRFLLIITNKILLNKLLNKSQNLEIQYNNHCQWIALDIESGYPCINPKTSEIFIPQSVNMDILGGISFNKGCYLGQELIARIQYHKLNKQSLYHLIGNIEKDHNNQCINMVNSQLANPGDHIEIKINNSFWKKIGTVLQICQMKNNKIWIQAVLNNKSITNTDQLRIYNNQRNNNLNVYIFKKN